jgi:PiT family inorganic phosphate transporter
LSFAHGANDVANAIWPLAAIVDTIQWWGEIHGKVGIPFWVMLFGALGLSVGLIVFGWRLIKTVWKGITKLNQSRAFAVALAAAITVIIASQLGLPVSSTHIAIWGIFGIGITRELLKKFHGEEKHYIEPWMIKHIALAWIITLPVSWCIAAWMYYMIMFITK